MLTATMLRRILGDGARDIQFHRSAARSLFAYDWPLNIRELEQALTGATALAEDTLIAIEHLPPAMQPESGEVGKPADREGDALREKLIALLRRHQGNVSAVARDLGKARVQIRRWCKRFDLDPDDYRD
jgi:transcriptional regulator of acetoin/glycerol metabolism